MRKLIIVLLATLLLFSFTSCNQDKIDDLENQLAQKEAEKKTYQEFVDALTDVAFISDGYEGVVEDGSDSYKSGTITLDSSYDAGHTHIQPSLNGGDLNAIWFNKRVISKNPNVYRVNSPSTTGTVTCVGTLTKNDLNYTIDNNTVTAPCEDKDGNDISVELNINGSLSIKKVKSEDNTLATATISFKGNIFGKQIELSCTIETTVTSSKFTAAKINGKDVDLELLNSIQNGGLGAFDYTYRLTSID